jgi:DNA-binding CsgD family transcriptional regulator
MTATTTDSRPAAVPMTASRTIERVRLTPREREVVALAREGNDTRAIGRRLHISTRAADALLRDARLKLTAGVSK